MAITIPRPAPKLVEPPPALAQSTPAGLTVAEVEAMLAARDAVWGNQLAILTQALTDALKAPPAPRRPVAIKFKFERGAIVGADLIPVE